MTPSTINEIPVSITSDRMQELARLTFQAGHNTSQPIQIDRMNEFLREDKSINSEEHPFQSLMIEELLGNIKMEKKDLIQKLLSDDAKELISCLEVGAYKACI